MQDGFRFAITVWRAADVSPQDGAVIGTSGTDATEAFHRGTAEGTESYRLRASLMGAGIRVVLAWHEKKS